MVGIGSIAGVEARLSSTGADSVEHETSSVVEGKKGNGSDGNGDDDCDEEEEAEAFSASPIPYYYFLFLKNYQFIILCYSSPPPHQLRGCSEKKEEKTANKNTTRLTTNRYLPPLNSSA